LGINNRGVMVGQYGDADGVYHGFVATDHQITTVDVQGSAVTLIQSINDWGTSVGFWSSNGQDAHGFIRSPSGAITTIDVPGAFGGAATVATGINDQGVVVGYYFDSTAAQHGFMYRDGQFTTVDVPGYAPPTAGAELWGINNFGVLDGLVYSGFTGAAGSGTDQGFTFATRVPHAHYKFFLGAGDTGAANSNAGTFPQGINDWGAVVGHSMGSLNYGVFVGWEMIHGKMITISDPLAANSIPPGTGYPDSFVFGGTAPAGVNDFGTVTGIYWDSNNNPQGFIATLSR